MSIVPLSIILRPELTRERELLDIHIEKLISSGEFKRILTRHIKH